jgi:hypothetical protein
MIQSLRSLDRILKGQATDPVSLRQGRLQVPLGSLPILLVVLGALYGVCMGAYALAARWGMGEAHLGFVQMGYSAAKVPMLFLFTLAVTLPSLYVFNALVGCRLLFSTVLRLLVAALGVTLSVLASFGTIIAFFSFCTTSYPFMVLLNVVTFVLAGVLGMNFLLQTLHRIAVAQTPATDQPPIEPTPPDAAPLAPAPPSLGPGNFPGALDRVAVQGVGSQVRMVFLIWVMVFGLVGSQMGWILRPFIGAPDAPVTFFRSREGSFFQAVIDKVQDLAQGRNPHPRSTR